MKIESRYDRPYFGVWLRPENGPKEVARAAVCMRGFNRTYIDSEYLAAEQTLGQWLAAKLQALPPCARVLLHQSPEDQSLDLACLLAHPSYGARPDLGINPRYAPGIPQFEEHAQVVAQLPKLVPSRTRVVVCQSAQTVSTPVGKLLCATLYELQAYGLDLHFADTIESLNASLFDLPSTGWTVAVVCHLTRARLGVRVAVDRYCFPEEIARHKNARHMPAIVDISGCHSHILRDHLEQVTHGPVLTSSVQVHPMDVANTQIELWTSHWRNQAGLQPYADTFFHYGEALLQAQAICIDKGRQGHDHILKNRALFSGWCAGVDGEGPTSPDNWGGPIACSAD
ncbi:MAG: hypothetical protein ACPG4T_09645 [Nannocystaceae bacterium]